MSDCCSEQKGPLIPRGYPWALRIIAEDPNNGNPAPEPMFPEGIEIIAQFRATPGSDTILASITTADDSILRISDSEIEIRLESTITVAWPDDLERVFVDFIRENESDPILGEYLYLGFRLEIPVYDPVTRGLQ